MLLAVCAVALTMPAVAEQPKPIKVGFLYPGMAPAAASRVADLSAAVRSGMGAQGANVEIVSAIAHGEPARLPALAADLVRAEMRIIFAASPAAIQAARGATSSIPIVALDLESDPVASGLIQSLARPGGNITGVFLDLPEFGAKWLELLLEVAPRLGRIAVLWDSNTGSVQLDAIRKVIAERGLTPQVMPVATTAEIAPAFQAAVDAKCDGLVILSSPLFGGNIPAVAQLSRQHRLPAITLFPEFAQSGGLMAYGPSLTDLFRQGGELVAKVLNGASTAVLPAERPSRFQLIVNLQTAQALGLTVSPTVLARADDTIE